MAAMAGSSTKLSSVLGSPQRDGDLSPVGASGRFSSRGTGTNSSARPE